MDKVLIILVVLLIIAVVVLFFVVKPKKKKDTIEEVEITREEPVIDLSQSIEEPVEEKNRVEEKNEETIKKIESLDDEFEKTKEQTEVIEIIESMQEKAKDITERVADYEDEQEENAIISYTELLNAVKAKKDVQEELDLSQTKEEKPKEEIKVETVNVIKENKPYDEQKKFHSSEAISPLGRINKNVTDDSYKSNKRPDNMQDEEFLKSLKDFRGNL